ncbi:MAG: hypothetical protein KKC75_05315 [Nanoarchaeota archaeon]|nr:hypothetical protein [Nanoarchaeota archaeon]MBU1005183.1 hypothetical protein [Nanoarchaeota archaeon]MBU1946799.1 hypothetical protein [Nanoarchaeota archaeon]
MELKILEKYPIITKAEIKKIISCSDSYAYTVLNRLLERGKIKKVIKGKYTTKDDIYPIATNLFYPCYLSFWSCSYFKGYTGQILNTLQIATTRPHRDINFENYTIKFIKMSKKTFFGYEKVKYADNFIFLADNEKLIIDLISHEHLAGNFDEIIQVINSSSIDENKLVNYLKFLNNKSLMKRLGFLLEHYKGIDISEKIKYRDNNIIQLFRYLGKRKINKKWQVKHDI